MQSRTIQALHSSLQDLSRSDSRPWTIESLTLPYPTTTSRPPFYQVNPISFLWDSGVLAIDRVVTFALSRITRSPNCLMRKSSPDPRRGVCSLYSSASYGQNVPQGHFGRFPVSKDKSPSWEPPELSIQLPWLACFQVEKTLTIISSGPPQTNDAILAPATPQPLHS